ncbi:uncharacterized protein LOC109830667 isoform X2 [Asparagus officinalis]|uniref:uncharacterized protein LOC109830667 isoform X2 n=1 Tax=Asparagus officinalis TaxID=4686 RepID=UPI00098E5CFB|nr:uncharacterized protein LOC109830667 isoform X2 [Asparagus officinalis]
MGSAASCDDSLSNMKEIFLEDLDSPTADEELDEDFEDSIVKELGSSLCETQQIHDLQPSIEHEKSSYDDPENAEEILLEDIHSSTREEPEEDFKDSTVKELGISLYEALQIHDPSEPLCVRNSISNEESICDKLEVVPLSFDTDVLEVLNKHATILCSELAQSYLINADAGAGLSCTMVQNENSYKAESVAFVQPLPAMTKLIPALKGSRAQNGIHLDTKLSVKWAPEVYDPPITSSSHTVKGHWSHHHHGSKAKKDYLGHHKYSRGKSSRNSIPERKRSHRRTTSSSLIDPRVSRLQELSVL